MYLIYKVEQSTRDSSKAI